MILSKRGVVRFTGHRFVIIVAIDRRFPSARYLDLGLGIAYLLLAAEAKGIATCPIGLITAYSDEICEALDIPEEREVALGIAVGYADPDAPLNQLRTERAEKDEILSWYE